MIKVDRSIIYGPVNSRRFGYSLGINLGDPKRKSCSWNCLYCQCGTHNLPLSSANLPSREEVHIEARKYLLAHPDILAITLAGNSEPTTHPDFSGVVSDLLHLRKELQGKWIINSLSNGSMLHCSNVVAACNLLDEAWIKLDCGLDKDFLRFNRPRDEITVAEHLRRLRNLNKLRIQVLFCAAEEGFYGNWTKENKDALLDIITTLKPKNIHITTLDRPTVYSQLKAVSLEELQDFTSLISRQNINIEVFGKTFNP